MSPGQGFDPAALASEPPQMTEALRRLEAICPQFRQSDQACACRPDGGGCHRKLSELLADLMAFLVDRFRDEELAMKRWLVTVVDPRASSSHIEDHADFTAALGGVIVRLDTSPVHDLLCELDGILRRWRAEHFPTHDQYLAALLERLAQPAGRGA